MTSKGVLEKEGLQILWICGRSGARIRNRRSAGESFLVRGVATRHDPLNWHLLPDGFQAPSARISLSEAWSGRARSPTPASVRDLGN